MINNLQFSVLLESDFLDTNAHVIGVYSDLIIIIDEIMICLCADDRDDDHNDTELSQGDLVSFLQHNTYDSRFQVSQ